MNVPIFDFSAIKTRSGCDEPQAFATTIQAALSNKDTNLDYQEGVVDTRVNAAQDALITVEGELAAMLVRITRLPAGPSHDRDVLESKQADLVARQKRLALRGGSGAQDALQQLAEARNAADLELATAFLTQLAAYRLTLPS